MKSFSPLSVLLLSWLCLVLALPAQSEDLQIRIVREEARAAIPVVLLRGARHMELFLELKEPALLTKGRYEVTGLFTPKGEPLRIEAKGEARIALPPFVVKARQIRLQGLEGDEKSHPIAVEVVPGWVSIAPPLVAILLAILLKQVLVALFVGLVAGAVVLHDSILGGFLRTVDLHLIQSLHDESRLKIIVFSLFLGGVVALVARMGGMRAIVQAVIRRGGSRRGVLGGTWLMGIIIFFDDYANALLVGNTARPMTDKSRISREKLAWIVDSTSAPVACIAVISTWVVAQVSLIDDWLKDAQSAGPASVGGYTDAYQLFLEAIPHNYYPWFALFFALMVILFGRDFGPMLKAERRALSTGQVSRPGAVPMSGDELQEVEAKAPARPRWFNGVLPIGVVVFSVIFGLYFDGIKKVANPESLDFFTRLREAFGQANSYDVLIMASLFGLCTAFALALMQRVLTLAECVETSVRGMKAMFLAILVLCLAWALSDLCKSLSTAGWLIESVNLSFQWLPAIAFLLAALVGFSTGSSWGSMGILIPLTLAYAHQAGLELLAEAVGDAAKTEIAVASIQNVLLGTIGAVLAGSVFGDHCSPISDTTVMSSMASSCDHIDHVKTQAPYAIVVAVVALGVGYLPAGYGAPAWVSLAVGAALIALVVRFIGRRAAADA